MNSDCITECLKKQKLQHSHWQHGWLYWCLGVRDKSLPNSDKCMQNERMIFTNIELVWQECVKLNFTYIGNVGDKILSRLIKNLPFCSHMQIGTHKPSWGKLLHKYLAN